MKLISAADDHLHDADKYVGVSSTSKHVKFEIARCRKHSACNNKLWLVTWMFGEWKRRYLIKSEYRLVCFVLWAKTHYPSSSRRRTRAPDSQIAWRQTMARAPSESSWSSLWKRRGFSSGSCTWTFCSPSYISYRSSLQLST